MNAPVGPIKLGIGPCRNCKYFLRESPDLTKAGRCMRNPPAHFEFPMGQDANGQVMWASRSNYPLVRAELGCGEFKASLVNEGVIGNS